MWLSLFAERARDRPRRPAVVTPRETLDYGELLGRATVYARTLRSDGVPAGSRRLLVADDPLELVISLIGCWMHGVVPAVCDPALREPILARYGPLFEPGNRAGRASTNDAEQEGLVLTTSGSIGSPKLVALPHRSVRSNAAALLASLPMPEDTRQLVATPLSRGTGLSSALLTGLAAGWTSHLYPPQTPPPVLQRAIREHGIGFINATPSFFRLFLSYWNGKEFPSVRLAVSGAEPNPGDLLQRLMRTFPSADVYSAYGMTETGPRIGQVRVEPGVEVDNALGRPLPHFDHKLLAATGASRGEGELALRGPSLFLGYLQPDGTYAGLDDEGYFHTRDLVRADADGRLFFCGRVDSLVKIRGCWANPFEIERVIRAVPGVDDAVCFARSDPTRGPLLVAEYIASDSPPIEPRAVARAIAPRLQRHEVPTEIRCVPALRRSALGKVSRMGPTPPQPGDAQPVGSA